MYTCTTNRNLFWSHNTVCITYGSMTPTVCVLCVMVMLCVGFSKKVIAAFKKGFPPTWKEIIQEHNEGTMTCRR